MYKQVIVVRQDLKMSKGKLAAQAAHAAVEAYKIADPDILKEWEDEGSKKVIVAVKDIKELFKVQENAKELDLPCSMIRDAGKTEIPPGTLTAIGIGPDEEKKIDKVTGSLKKLR